MFKHSCKEHVLKRLFLTTRYLTKKTAKDVFFFFSLK